MGRRGLFTFLAALIHVGGSLGDSLGRQRIFALGIVLFAAASILCGFAPNVTFLIVARAIKGIGGALLVPGSLAIINASFDKGQRGWAFGTWSGFTAITSVVNPVLEECWYSMPPGAGFSFSISR